MDIITKEIRGQTIQVVQYQSYMNQALIKLDQAAQMGNYLGGLIKTGRNIKISYDQIIKYKGYTQGFVLVARVKNAQIIGKVSVGLKQVVLFGKKQKIAYIFDLRIDLANQRGGIGKLIMQAVQQRSSKYNFTAMVCSVNHNNTKSMNFFLKTLNFSVGSHRKIYSTTCIKQKFIQSQQFILKDKSVCKIDFINKQNRRINQIQNFQQEQYDYSLLDFTQLKKQPKYLGSITAENNQNNARIHLYKGDDSFGMTAIKFFFPVRYWDKLYIKVFVMFLLLSGPLAMIYKSIDWPMKTIKKTGLLSAGIALSVVLSFIQIGFYKLKSIAMAPFLRIFGYRFKGNRNEQQILNLMLKQARVYASTQKARTLRINQDIRQQYINYIKKDLTSFGGKINTIFLYKLLNAKEKNERQFSVQNFFDPRDI